jgi:hypothetical protein
MNVRFAAAIVVAAASAAAAAGAGIAVRASYGARLTGDEPHYVLTAISLAEDRSLDVSDEIAAGRFRDFHEVDLDPQARRLEGGRRVEPHDPLLPALLAAPVALGGWVAAKATLVAANALLAALLLWTAVRRYGVNILPAVIVVVGFTASAPFAVYGNQIYPELPAALALTAAIAALTGTPGATSATVIGGAVVALPWLSVKFVPVATVLAVLAMVRLVRAHRTALAGALALGLGIAGAVFLATHSAWYGGLTPYASGDHFVSGELSVVGFDPDFIGRSQRLIALLVDRTFGLAAWQPAWLIGIPALGALMRARPRFWETLVVPLVAGWLTATFVAVTMHGWWWPGRQVVVVLPCVVLAAAWWTQQVRSRSALMAVAAALGVGTYLWVVADGLGGRITWVVDFFRTTNPFYGAWRVLLPDYMAASAHTWALHGVWLGVALFLAVLGWRRARRGDRDSLTAAGSRDEPSVSRLAAIR